MSQQMSSEVAQRENSKRLAQLINECIQIGENCHRRIQIEMILEANFNNDIQQAFDPMMAGSLVADVQEMWVAICRLIRKSNLESETGIIWRQKCSSDFGDFFVLGAGTKEGSSASYFLPMDRWNDCYFAKEIEIKEKFPAPPKGYVQRNGMEQQRRTFIQEIFP